MSGWEQIYGTIDKKNALSGINIKNYNHLSNLKKLYSHLVLQPKLYVKNYILYIFWFITHESTIIKHD